MKNKLTTNERLISETIYHWYPYLKTHFSFVILFIAFGYWLNHTFIFLFLGTFYIAYKNFERLKTKWIITNKRLIFEKDFISTITHEFGIDKINSISVNQNFREKNWGYGTIKINFSNKHNIQLQYISNPNEFKESLSEALNKNKIYVD